MILLTIILSNFILISGERVRYDNYRVYSVIVESVNQSKVLNDHRNAHDGILFMETLTNFENPIDIVVSPHEFAEINTLFETYEIKNQIKIENLQT